MKYKECYEKFNEKKLFIVRKKLKYLNEVDDLRLMFFIIGDIEYYYNINNKNYNWNYGITQIDTMGEILDFQAIDNVRFANPILSKNLIIANKYMLNNNNELKFYDSEDNMTFLNRLFDVLGILCIQKIHKL